MEPLLFYYIAGLCYVCYVCVGSLVCLFVCLLACLLARLFVCLFVLCLFVWRWSHGTFLLSCFIYNYIYIYIYILLLLCFVLIIKSMFVLCCFLDVFRWSHGTLARRTKRKTDLPERCVGLNGKAASGKRKRTSARPKSAKRQNGAQKTA